MRKVGDLFFYRTFFVFLHRRRFKKEKGKRRNSRAECRQALD